MNYPTEQVAREFVVDMKKADGQDVEINQQFANASFIILWRILSGVQYEVRRNYGGRSAEHQFQFLSP